MSVQRTYTRSVAGDGLSPQSYSKAVTTGIEKRVSEAVPDSTTDMLLDLAIDVDLLKGLIIASDQDVTIEINYPGGTSTASDQTLTVLANQPLMWCYGDPDDCPLDQDVTAIYATNASGSEANVEIIAQVDQS